MSELAPFKNSATKLANAVHQREIKPREILKFYQDRSDRYAAKLNCLLYQDQSWINSQLTELEARLDKGEKPLLAGVPVAIKDNISVLDVSTSCASKILNGFKPVYDATVVEKLRKAGAILFAKTNMDEFAMGSSNENSAYGPVRNPWDLERVPGGSSGGSAAVVAADITPLSLGSDTGGSIRQPASLCGVYGLKPTYGRVSRYGLVAFGSSLDQIGPFAQNVTDLARIYDVLSGHDPKDSTSLIQPEEKTFAQLKSKSTPPLAGVKIGRVLEFFQDGLQDDVRAAIEAAIKVYESLGAKICDISLPTLEYSIATYYVIATAEASSNLARYDGVRYGQRAKSGVDNLRDLYEKSRSEGFGREVKQRIMLGTFALSSGYYDAYYGKALAAQNLLRKEFRDAFAKVDFLISPTSPTTAFKIGEKSDDPLSMYLSDICTIAVNLVGVPALSLPAGFDGAGLPIGMQLIAPWLKETELLQGAYAYECATNWWQSRTPKLG